MPALATTTRATRMMEATTRARETRRTVRAKSSDGQRMRTRARVMSNDDVRRGTRREARKDVQREEEWDARGRARDARRMYATNANAEDEVVYDGRGKNVNASNDAEVERASGANEANAREAFGASERERREEEETTEEVAARERAEVRDAEAVSRRVFGVDDDSRAKAWTRGLFAGAALLFVAGWCFPRVVSVLCSYFEPLDTAVNAYTALTTNVGLDLRILRATATATFKVVALCVVITSLMREGKLPLETPVVVSKLAFNVLLPAYLCTRVAATLYLSPLTKALAILPISAMAQVIVGSCIGVLVTVIVNKLFDYTANQFKGKNEMSEEDGTRSEREKRDMSRLGIAACSFGNTFTLPLVFLTEVLGRARADETAGYIALYLIGWTPVLWTVGFLLIAGPVAVAGVSKDGEKKDVVKDIYLTTKATLGRISKELLNPPLLGIITGVFIGATPLKEIFVGNFAQATTGYPAILSFIAVAFRALFELAASIGAAALPGQMLVLASSLVKITPEDVEKHIARAAKAAARGAEGAEVEEVKTPAQKVLVFVIGAASGALNLTTRAWIKFRTAIAYLCNIPLADMRALTAACIVRFGVLPAACLFGLLFLSALNSPWFPSDANAALVLLTMSCMPAAQNLVLLTQLRDATRPLAPRLAAMMLRQYVVAIIPVTFWLTAFTGAVVPR